MSYIVIKLDSVGYIYAADSTSLTELGLRSRLSDLPNSVK